MDAHEGQVEQGLGHEVPVRDGVQAVGEDGAEAEVGRRGGRVERKRRAGQGAGAERGHVETGDRGHQAVDVAGQRPAVGQQVVRQQHGLGPLEVGVAGKVGVAGGPGPLQQHPLELHDAPPDGGQLVLAPQPEVGGHLVVPAAPGVQPGSGRPGQLGDPSLDGGVDVLVQVDEDKPAGRQLSGDPLERGEDGADLLLRQETGAGKTSDVRL